MDNPPLVSILCITFNHEKYIHEALDSFLMQNTNFPIEIIVADDASTDGTQAVIKKYQDNYPELIKPILRKKNIGPQPNWIDAAQNCQGKYIALCEGDDYWTDPYKLQKQVDFLETNEDYSICFHKVLIQNGEKFSDQYKKRVPIPKDTSTIADLAKGNFINTPSILFRRKHLPNPLPKYMNEAPIGDYPLLLNLAMHGKIKFINESMAVYRKHDSSMWSAKTFEHRHTKIIEYLEALIGNFPEEINQQFIERHGRYCWDMFHYYTKRKNTEKAIFYFKKGQQYNSQDFLNLVLNMKEKYDIISKIPFYSAISKIKNVFK